MIRVVETSAAALPADALQRMYDRDYQALWVRDAFDVEMLRQVAAALDDAGRYFPNESAQLFIDAATTTTEGMIILGDSISRKTPSYFDHADEFRAGCDRLFSSAGLTDWQAHLVEIFGQVSSGRPVEVPRNDSGRAYGTATLRLVKPGCHLLTHCGNYFYTWDSYDELRPMLDTSMQFSFFVVLREPEGGAELEIFEADYTAADCPLDERGMWNEPEIEARPSTRVRPRAGDMILFDGGRYFHRIRTVEGAVSRLTLGGFLAFSSDGRTLFHWA